MADQRLLLRMRTKVEDQMRVEAAWRVDERALGTMNLDSISLNGHDQATMKGATPR